ncbi:MAG: HAD-IA family hydrolase [Dehalococcoidia bacterium]|nr:HAD-IA family hydrolase [Dehalococcoidia bacterium]
MNTNGFPRALLLDLDDTIIDDTSSVATGWTAVCQEAATEAPGLDPALLKATIYQVRDWYWADPERARIGRHDLRAASAWIVDEALRRNGINAPRLGATIANRYRDLRDQDVTLLPGAIDAIERFKSAGIRLALLTNGGAAGQRAKLDRFDLARHFDYVCIEGEFGCGKPDERVYRAALMALGCAPSDAWMAGDNLEWDVFAPMKLGVKGIWLDRLQKGLPPGSAKPDRIILSLSELL